MQARRKPIIDKSKEWTMDDFALMEETNTPCEIIEGVLVLNPSYTPYHQLVLGEVFMRLRTEAKKNGDIVILPLLDLYINHTNVFQPDSMLIKKENRKIITERAVEGVPDLVVEVLDPVTKRTDNGVKKKIYLAIGVKEYWILDPLKETLEIYTPQTGEKVPRQFITRNDAVTTSLLPSLQFTLKEIFERNGRRKPAPKDVQPNP